MLGLLCSDDKLAKWVWNFHRDSSIADSNDVRNFGRRIIGMIFLMLSLFVDVSHGQNVELLKRRKWCTRSKLKTGHCHICERLFCADLDNPFFGIFDHTAGSYTLEEHHSPPAGVLSMNPPMYIACHISNNWMAHCSSLWVPFASHLKQFIEGSVYSYSGYWLATFSHLTQHKHLQARKKNDFYILVDFIV